MNSTTTKQEVRQKSLGISFSGGGVRSWAQVAAYKELETQGIEATAVAGTSMGSFIAAAVACGLSADEIYDIIRETDQAIDESNLFDHHAFFSMFSLRRPMGLVLMEKLAEVIEPVDNLYSEFMLSDVPTPLAIPAVDIIHNKLVVFSNNPEYFQLTYDNAEFYEGDISLLKACLASSAYPIVLSPVKIDDYQLVDGGVLVNTPANLFQKEKIEYVFSIGGGPMKEHAGPTDRRINVAMRSIDIMVNAQIRNSISEADQHYPLKLELPGTFEFGDSDLIIEAGIQYVKDNPIDTMDMFEVIEEDEEKETIEETPKIIIEDPEMKENKLEKFWEKVKDFFR